MMDASLPRLQTISSGFKPNKEFLLSQYMNRFELVSTYSKSLILKHKLFLLTLLQI